ncbi:hypothetical protein LTS10_003550 [Elasticomyces elasticus]|nr:hypothetical protein LTS10_003550 [Elasticomyces elasticus]
MTDNSPITLVATINIKEGKEERAEELWKVLHDDIIANEVGRVAFKLHRTDKPGTYIGIYEFASETVSKEWLGGPLHMEVGEKVSEEGLAATDPDIRWVRPVKWQ